jgi:two-component system NtrC family sensor kinase
LEDQIIRLCRAIASITDAMGSVAKWQDVLGCILHALVDELGYRAASVRQLDAERRTLLLVGAVNLSEEYQAKGAVEVERSEVDREVLEGRLVEIADVRKEPRLQYPDAAVQEGIGSVLAVPLSLKGQVTGVLHAYSDQPRTAPETEKHFLMSVGKLTARALASARQSEALLNISREVNSSLDLQRVLTAILRRTVEELNYRGGIIRLVSPSGQRLELVAAIGLSQAYLSKGVVEIGRSGINRKILQGDMVTTDDVAADPGYQYPQEALEEGIRSVQSVPPIAPDRSEPGGRRVIGVLRVYSSQPNRFGDEEVSLLQVIANLGAIALQNARLYHELNRCVDLIQPDEDGWHRIV